MPQFLIKDNTLLSHLIRLNIRLRRNYGTYAINAFQKSLLQEFHNHSKKLSIGQRSNIVQTLLSAYIYESTQLNSTDVKNATKLFGLSKSYIDYIAIFQKNAYKHGGIHKNLVTLIISKIQKVSTFTSFMNVISNNLVAYDAPRPWDLINSLYNDIFNHLILKTVFKLK